MILRTVVRDETEETLQAQESSFPRKRESRFVLYDFAWIPAFAGMTDLCPLW